MALEVELARWVAALAFAGVGLTASLVLVVPHVGRRRLIPGCAPQSGCAELNGSRWGMILGTPLSIWGAAWFAALLVLLLGTGASQGVPAALLWATRAGLLFSLFLMAAMVIERRFCVYCALVHAGNVGIWALAEAGPTAPMAPSPNVWVLAAGTFFLASTVLTTRRRQHKRASALRVEQQFQQSLQNLLEHMRRQRQGLEPKAAAVTGRWQCGSSTEPVQVVSFSDYQCSDCADADRQLKQVMGRWSDVAVVQKHSPLCKLCNRQVSNARMHLYACRAACAAEAAGMLGGDRGFWAMHGWLLARQAVFSDAELAAALPDLGISDVEAFCRAMDGPETLRRVRADIEEAIVLGVTGTPVVLINGMKLEGLGAPAAIVRAVEAVHREQLTLRPGRRGSWQRDGRDAA